MPTNTAADVLNRLWQTAEKLVAGGVTRSHDLTGMVFQRLIADRKFLATYYTRPAAAALLAGLALSADHPPRGSDWGDVKTLEAVQIGDFACGTGTLLSAAYQRLSLLHELHGGDSRALHATMMERGLVGLDVLNIAVHLTASMLAGAQPGTPFEGECLLTLPYGRWGKGKREVAIGSLDLLAGAIQPRMIEHAAAISAGGREPEEVRDLVDRIGHGKFDLVIMNPPFTRATGQEADARGKGNPAWAAFHTDKETQKRMTEKLRGLRGKEGLEPGNCGLGADFLQLALRKVAPNGTVAFVLPLSFASGTDWSRARDALSDQFERITVVTVAAGGTQARAFSADTNIADCLVVASRSKTAGSRTQRVFFVTLDAIPGSLQEGQLLAKEILRLQQEGPVARLESATTGTMLKLGDRRYGMLTDAPIPKILPWPSVGVSDSDLGRMAYLLSTGVLSDFDGKGVGMQQLPVAPIREVADRGYYHMDIYWDNADGSPRGPYEIQPLLPGGVPTLPVLWEHDFRRERMLVVKPDSEARLKQLDQFGAKVRKKMKEKAVGINATMTRTHYNRDLRFTSQSLVVAMTEQKCIGGHAWPSVIFDNPDHEYAFALWCNSTLGVTLHWWTTNKSQSGRGRTSVTAIPNIPTLDTRALSEEQHQAARDVFGSMRGLRFLPLNQIDEDPVRSELDRRLLVDVLRLPPSLCDGDGPIDLIRRKLAAEPQIRGGKKKRVVFVNSIDDFGMPIVIEEEEARGDL